MELLMSRCFITRANANVLVVSAAKMLQLLCPAWPEHGQLSLLGLKLDTLTVLALTAAARDSCPGKHDMNSNAQHSEGRPCCENDGNAKPLIGCDAEVLNLSAQPEMLPSILCEAFRSNQDRSCQMPTGLLGVAQVPRHKRPQCVGRNRIQSVGASVRILPSCPRRQQPPWYPRLSQRVVCSNTINPPGRPCMHRFCTS